MGVVFQNLIPEAEIGEAVNDIKLTARKFSELVEFVLYQNSWLGVFWWEASGWK
jgi:hypothetical protein